VYSKSTYCILSLWISYVMFIYCKRERVLNSVRNGKVSCSPPTSPFTSLYNQSIHFSHASFIIRFLFRNSFIKSSGTLLILHEKLVQILHVPPLSILSKETANIKKIHARALLAHTAEALFVSVIFS